MQRAPLLLFGVWFHPQPTHRLPQPTPGPSGTRTLPVALAEETLKASGAWACDPSNVGRLRQEAENAPN